MAVSSAMSSSGLAETRGKIIILTAGPRWSNFAPGRCARDCAFVSQGKNAVLEMRVNVDILANALAIFAPPGCRTASFDGGKQPREMVHVPKADPLGDFAELAIGIFDQVPGLLDSIALQIRERAHLDRSPEVQAQG